MYRDKFAMSYRVHVHVCTSIVARPGFPSLLDFVPSPEFPSLQYFDFIEENSVAANAGLRCGDFLLEVCQFVHV